jgi:dTDP-L-rhamnose 4-epimerase
MNILVTGGAGFVGSHLVTALVKQGHTVRVLDALVPQVHGAGAKWPARLPAKVERIQGDVRERAAWEQVLPGIDVVYHLAAEVGVGQSMYEITRYMGANTMGTALLLELLAQGTFRPQKLIVASSMSIYGEGAYQTRTGHILHPGLRSAARLARREWELYDPADNTPLNPLPTPEDKPLAPNSIYAISKRDQEEMCLAVGRAYRLPTVALRFFNIYGDGQALSNPYTGVAAIFSSRLLNGKPPLIFEDGGQSRDFVHVSDIVQALQLARECESANYEVINVGTGRAVSILEVADALIHEMGSTVKPELRHQFREGDIRHCFADIAKAKRLLGFRPNVPFETGIEELVRWVRTQVADDRVEQATAELAAHGLAH